MGAHGHGIFLGGGHMGPGARSEQSVGRTLEDWKSWKNHGSADTSTNTATSPLQSEVIPRSAFLLGTLPRSHDMNVRFTTQ